VAKAPAAQARVSSTMKKTIAAVGIVAGLCGTVGGVFAAEPGQIARGQEKYEYWCATCHAGDPREGGRYLPGTASLNAKYKGDRPGALADRTDLLAPYVKLVIRRGMEAMPFFRKTEISDAEMEDIAAYLARNAK